MRCAFSSGKAFASWYPGAGGGTWARLPATAAETPAPVAAALEAADTPESAEPAPVASAGPPGADQSAMAAARASHSSPKRCVRMALRCKARPWAKRLMSLLNGSVAVNMAMRSKRPRTLSGAISTSPLAAAETLAAVMPNWASHCCCCKEALPTRGRPHGRPSGLVKSLGADDLPTGGISMSASSRTEHTMRKAGMDHSGFACT